MSTDILERAADGVANVLEWLLPDVGWIDDVIKIEVFFDADLCDIHSEENHDSIPLFVAGAHVSGFVRITTANAGRVVSYDGIRAVFRTFLVTSDATTSRTLREAWMDIAPAGELKGSMDIPFTFPASITATLAETYEGSLFSLRAAVSIHIARPWYTFEIVKEKPFAIQRLFEIPNTAAYEVEISSSGETSVPPDAIIDDLEHENDEVNHSSENETELSSSMQAKLALYGPQIATLEDAEDQSLVEIALDKGCYDVKQKLTGAIQFSGVSVPIIMVKLALLKVEYLNGETEDVTIFEEYLVDSRKWFIRQLENETSTAIDIDNFEYPQDPQSWIPSAEELSLLTKGGDVDSDMPIVGDVNLGISLDFSHVMDIEPTICFAFPTSNLISNVEGEDENEAIDETIVLPGNDYPPLLSATNPSLVNEDISVRFFVRVSIQAVGGRKRWICREILMYRSEISGIPAPDIPTLDVKRTRTASASSIPSIGAASPRIKSNSFSFTDSVSASNVPSDAGVATSASAASPRLGGISTPSRSRSASLTAKLSPLGEGRSSAQNSLNSSFTLSGSARNLLNAAAVTLGASVPETKEELELDEDDLDLVEGGLGSPSIQEKSDDQF
jgi:Vacuolar protein sorting-associated protein 26